MITRQQFYKILSIFLVWRISLFVFGAVAHFFLEYKPSFPYWDSMLMTSGLPQWLFSWVNFDGVHYVTIAEKGYLGTGLIQAFFPLLPFVVLRSIFLLTHLNTIAFGLFLTNLFALLFLIAWFAFAKQQFNEKFAWVSLFVFLLFPTSFFFGALYTESLFLLLTVLSFYFAHQKKWLVVSILTLLATATRLVGIFLVPALLFEYFWQLHETQKLKKNFSLSQHWQPILLILLGSAGLLSYMAFLTKEFHDPLYFLNVQSEFGGGRQESIVLYPQVVWRSLKILLTVRPFDWKYFAYTQEFLAGTLSLLALATAAFKYKKIRPSHTLFAMGAFILPTLTGTFSSMPRYVLVCFPIFFLLTNFVQKRKLLGVLLLSVFLLLLIINTVLFIQGYWVA